MFGIELIDRNKSDLRRGCAIAAATEVRSMHANRIGRDLCIAAADVFALVDLVENLVN
jgi:hypothetical protein